MFADDDFNSSEHCCVCGGGAEIAVPAQAPEDAASTGSTPEEEPLEIVCLDTAGEALDSGSDGCSWYSMYADYCGSYDDEDFTASAMCCGCGGGSYMVEEDGAIENAIEAIVHEIEEPHTEAEVEERVEEWREYNHSYRPIKDLIDGLNDVGTAPEFFANMTRIMLIDELRRVVNEADHALDEVKREILREIAQPLLLSAESDAALAAE